MRKVGEQIRDKRIKFKENLQKEFLRNIKNESKLTWKFLAKKLNVCEHTIRVDWQKEGTTIPYKICLKLIKKYPFKKWQIIKSEWIEEILPSNWGQKKAGGINKKHITIPNKSEELAELIGVILGDGHIGKKEITITGEFPHQEKHLEYIKEKIKKLFGIDSRIFISYTNDNTIILDCYSVEIVNFLKKNKLYPGNKIKNKLSFPKWIFKKKDFIKGALRGLIDTDGGVYYKQKGYKRAIIEFQNYSPQIKRDIILFIKKIGFNPSKSQTINERCEKRHNIRIQNQEEVRSFFKLIGSSNPKNIIKYKCLIEKGFMPQKEELKKEIIQFNEILPFRMQ